MKTKLYTLLFFISAFFVNAQTATKEQIISELPIIEITEGINLHIISPEPIQYVDLSTNQMTGDLPSTNIARIKITDNPETDAKEKLKIYWSSETMQEVVAGFSIDTSRQKSLAIIKEKLKQDKNT